MIMLSRHLRAITTESQISHRGTEDRFFRKGSFAGVEILAKLKLQACPRLVLYLPKTQTSMEVIQ